MRLVLLDSVLGLAAGELVTERGGGSAKATEVRRRWKKLTHRRPRCSGTSCERNVVSYQVDKSERSREGALKQLERIRPLHDETLQGRSSQPAKQCKM